MNAQVERITKVWEKDGALYNRTDFDALVSEIKRLQEQRDGLMAATNLLGAPPQKTASKAYMVSWLVYYSEHLEAIRQQIALITKESCSR
jgi:hypothetical protein